MTPHRQIRALYDDHHITVYQAYSDTIADAALDAQKINASPAFRPSRMTWIKPSWCWMMYRSGYSRRDPCQARILALKMHRRYFDALLAKAVLSHSSHHSHHHHHHHSPPSIPTSTGPLERAEVVVKTAERTADSVRVQWDPERTARLEKLPYRSIQIGIPGCLSEHWASEAIVSIEDVTARAWELERVLKEEQEQEQDKDGEEPGVSEDDLTRRGLLPRELPYPVSDDILFRLQMTTSDV